MNIAIIHSTLDFEGGAERTVLNLAREILNLGKNVDVYSISFNKRKCYPELNKNLNIYSLMDNFPYYSWRNQIFSPLEFLSKIYYGKRLSSRLKGHYDILNCHNFPSTITAIEVKKKKDTPVVWFCHEPLNIVQKNFPVNFIKKYEKKLIDEIDEIVTYPFYNRPIIEKIYGRTPKEVLPGIDLEKFLKGDSEKIKENFHLSDNVLLFVGQLIKDKRVQDIIKALKIVLDEGISACLIIVGDGNYKNELTSLANRLGISDNVVFTGYVNQKDLPHYYACADVFLNPSIKQSWGLAPFEALAAETSVIVSRDTGGAEVIKKEGIGIVLEPMNPNIWGREILNILEDTDKQTALGKKGNKWVKKNMKWNKFAHDLLTIFESVI